MKASASPLYHHHSEIVAVIHFFVRFIGCDTFSLAFVGQYLGIVMTAFGFGFASQVDDFDTVEAETEITSEIFDEVGITQQDRVAYTFLICCNGGRKHIDVVGFRRIQPVWETAWPCR